MPSHRRCPNVQPRRSLRAAIAAASALGVATLAAPAAHAAVTISPLPGTPTAMPATQISFLGAAPGTLSKVSVVGSRSGRHRGRLLAYASVTGQSFLPSKPFRSGERVSVRAEWRAKKGRSAIRLSDTFTIARSTPVALNEFPGTPGTPADVQNFVSQPELHPPALTVRQASAGTAPGLLFTAPFLGPAQWGPAIYDNAGNLVWFQSVPTGIDAADFRVQGYAGKPVLTWWQGRTLSYGYGLGEGLIADTSYRTIAHVKTGNGLQADEHEFLLTPRGSAYLLAYSPVFTSLASAGGPANGIAFDGVIQQVDIRTGLVMWEWHSLGHEDVSASYSKAPTSPENAYDYFHINSLTVDAHGNLLISARNTWALYEIAARTGAVVWRLGGKRSTFTLGPGVPFAYQHNALWLGPGQISIFDDEGAPPVKPPARGEVINLNLAAKTATLAAQFVHAPGLLTPCCGNAQSLAGGNFIVGWGGIPNFTEFNARGETVFDAQFPRGEFDYRTYRFPWSAEPATPPSVAARSLAGATTVYASWNGATDVAAWQLLTGPSAAHLSPAGAPTPRSGFETAIPAPSAAFYGVRALGSSGSALGSSAGVAATGG